MSINYIATACFECPSKRHQNILLVFQKSYDRMTTILNEIPSLCSYTFLIIKGKRDTYISPNIVAI